MTQSNLRRKRPISVRDRGLAIDTSTKENTATRGPSSSGKGGKRAKRILDEVSVTDCRQIKLESH